MGWQSIFLIVKCTNLLGVRVVLEMPSNLQALGTVQTLLTRRKCRPAPDVEKSVIPSQRCKESRIRKEEVGGGRDSKS